VQRDVVRHVANSNIRTKAADKTLELSQIKLKALKFTKNHGFHGNSRKSAFFTEEGQFHEKCHGREIVN